MVGSGPAVVVGTIRSGDVRVYGKKRSGLLFVFRKAAVDWQLGTYRSQTTYIVYKTSYVTGITLLP